MARKRQIYIPIAGKAGARTRAQLREYAKYKPALKKLVGKQRLTPAEYGQFTRAKRQLRHTENLHPVTEKQAKKLRKEGLLVGKGVRAIRMRNTAADAKVRVLKSGIVVVSNGRHWEYHPVEADVQVLIDYGLSLLDNPETQRIALWTTKGRSDESFASRGAWVAYLRERFSKYVQVMDFTIGIAREIKQRKPAK
jgi:hypothetical protein